jgi:hypothetical protein
VAVEVEVVLQTTTMDRMRLRRTLRIDRQKPYTWYRAFSFFS